MFTNKTNTRDSVILLHNSLFANFNQIYRKNYVLPIDMYIIYIDMHRKSICHRVNANLTCTFHN